MTATSSNETICTTNTNRHDQMTRVDVRWICYVLPTLKARAVAVKYRELGVIVLENAQYQITESNAPDRTLPALQQHRCKQHYTKVLESCVKSGEEHPSMGTGTHSRRHSHSYSEFEAKVSTIAC